jgi:hypothetical protein
MLEEIQAVQDVMKNDCCEVNFYSTADVPCYNKTVSSCYIIDKFEVIDIHFVEAD